MHLENTSARYTVVSVPFLSFFPSPLKKVIWTPTNSFKLYARKATHNFPLCFKLHMLNCMPN